MYIRPKGRGVWQCVWEVRDPATGRRRRLTEIVRGPKKAAEARWVARQAELAAAAARPQPLHPRDWTCGDLVTHWLREVAEIDATTRARYADLVRHQILPTLGAIPLVELHPSHIQAAERAWLATGRVDGRGGLSASSVRQAHAILQAALRQAVAWDLLPVSPMARVRRPRLTPPPPVVWTPETVAAWWAARAAGARPPRPPGIAVWSPADIRRFWTVAARHRHGRLFMVVLRTGLRQGEALGLGWADVDWAAPALRVHRQLLPDGTLGPVKTAAGRRTIALDAATVTLLRRERAAQRADRLACGPGYQDQGLVFQTAVGTAFRHRNTNRLLLQLQRQAGVAPIRFHDLRHTHASLLIAAGADPRLVAERLGHTQVAFTLQVYGHLWPGRQAEVLTGLPALDGEG
jgi:integrase